MDNVQFDRLLREFLANQWRMFWCTVGTIAGGVVILSTVFYATTRSDLQTILRALEASNRQQTSSGNSVHISGPRTIEDNARDILRKQGMIQ